MARSNQQKTQTWPSLFWWTVSEVNAQETGVLWHPLPGETALGESGNIKLISKLRGMCRVSPRGSRRAQMTQGLGTDSPHPSLGWQLDQMCLPCLLSAVCISCPNHPPLLRAAWYLLSPTLLPLWGQCLWTEFRGPPCREWRGPSMLNTCGLVPAPEDGSVLGVWNRGPRAGRSHSKLCSTWRTRI